MKYVQKGIFTARVRSTREGNVLTLSVHQGEGGGGTLLTGSWSLLPGPFQGEGRGWCTLLTGSRSLVQGPFLGVGWGGVPMF